MTGNHHKSPAEIPWSEMDLRAQTESVIRRRWPEVYEEIQCEYAGQDLSWPEKKWLWERGMSEPPTCPVCGGKVGWHGRQKGYGWYCSPKCSNSDPMKKEKTVAAVMEKWGVANVAQREDVKKKRMDTVRERYGVDNVFQDGSVQEKCRESMKERYGVEWALQSENIQKRRRENAMEKWGEDHPMKVKEIRDKVSQSNMLSYNPESHTIAMRKLYGVDNAMQCSEYADKQVDSHNNTTILKNNLSGITSDGQWICKCPHPECDKCTEKTYNIYADQYYARKEFGIESCTKLLPIQKSRSKDTYIEQFVKGILDEHGVKYICNDRTVLPPQELDIYIPGKGIAVECNGCYWHSWPRKERKYHMNKWIACDMRGVQLISVWEDQIRNTPEIVRDVILSKLGIYDKRVGARVLDICEIGSKECCEFLDKNHLQGRCRAKVHLALRDGDGMIHSVMTFSRRSKVSGGKNDSDTWELTRYCNRRGEQVIGGAGKLLKYFIKTYHPDKVVSFSSNDISNGGLYRSLGFERGDDEPTGAYWYVSCEDGRRYHRSTFMKGNLARMGYDIEGKTEDEIMMALPFMKIYDSGHLRWELTLKP